jgi:hypothetical protein
MIFELYKFNSLILMLRENQNNDGLQFSFRATAAP